MSFSTPGMDSRLRAAILAGGNAQALRPVSKAPILKCKPRSGSLNPQATLTLNFWPLQNESRQHSFFRIMCHQRLTFHVSRVTYFCLRAIRHQRALLAHGCYSRLAFTVVELRSSSSVDYLCPSADIIRACMGTYEILCS